VYTINNPRNRDRIARGREIKEDHELVVCGIGLKEYLRKIEGFETEKLFELKKNLIKERIVPIYDTNTKPMNKIFSANGGSTKILIEDEKKLQDFEEKIKTLKKNGYGVEKWMELIWKTKVNIDPNGIAFLEMEKEIPDSPYLTYKAITDIYDYDYTNLLLDYVIFEPIEIKEKSKIKLLALLGINERYNKSYRVVDDALDYEIFTDGKNWVVNQENTIPNYFGKTPGIILSTALDDKTNARNTYIFKSLSLAFEWIQDYSINVVYKTKQAFPYVGAVASACPECKGEGDLKGVKCERCSGTGETQSRDVSEVRSIPVNPETGEVMLKGNIAQFIQPDLNTCTKQEETMKMEEESIYSTTWGGVSDVSKTNKNEKTAFEISILREPETAKLNTISSNAELVTNSIIGLLGKLFYPDDFKGVEKRFGRRYDIKSTDELLEIYENGVKEGLAVTILNRMLLDYYQSFFKNSPDLLARQIKLMDIEPFLHNKMMDAEKLAISGKKDVDYIIKLNLTRYLNKFETETGKKIENPEIESVEVYNKLKEYVKEDNINLTI